MDKARIRKTIAILLALMFLASLTVGAVSAKITPVNAKTDTLNIKPNKGIKNGFLKILPGYPSCDVCRKRMRF